MALQHLRSSTANKRPTPAGMSDGQLALNTNDASPGLFFKDSNGALVKVGPVHVGTTAPNATPGSGGSSGNAIGEQWLDTTGGTYVFKVWDGSAWRSESGTFVDVNGDVMTGALGIIAGSAGSPGLYFSGDTNTGLYSPGADQVAISTGGSRRFSIDSGGTVLVGSGAVNPAGVGAGPTLSITGDAPEITLRDSATGNPYAWMATNDFGSLILAADHGNNAASSIIDFRVDGTERMRIDSSGRLGVGTSSPGTALDVNGVITSRSDSFAAIRFKSSTGTDKAFLSYEDGSTSVFLNNYGSGPIVFKTVDAERVRIDSSGRVGIGTSTPARTFHVVGRSQFQPTTGTSVITLVNTSGGDGSIEVSGTATTMNYGFSTYSTGNALYIQNDGKVGIGSSTPDQTLVVNGGVGINNGGGSGGSPILTITNSGGSPLVNATNNSSALRFGYNGTEAFRVDSSRRLLVGTSSAYTEPYLTGAGYGSAFVVARNAFDGVAQFSNWASVSVDPSQIFISRCRSGTIGTHTGGALGINEGIGALVFNGSDGGAFRTGAVIQATIDGAVSSGDLPTRLVFSTTADGASSPTERMRIDSTGRLFLNTTASPSTTSFGTSIGTVLAHSRDTSTGAVAQIYGSAGEFRIIGSGNAQNTNNSYGAISDQSLKTDISDAGSQWDDIKGITVRKFKLIGTDTLQIGVVAQECELVSPGLVEDTVLEQEDGTTSTVKAVKYSVLYMKAVKALQEAMERIEQLEQRLAAAGI